MFYTIYKITNSINNKIYIGCHKTNDLDDGYMGSGAYLRRSQEKHGIKNFKKEILHVFDNPQEMFAKEAELVDEDFIAEENTYNLMIGGRGGFDYINENRLNVHEFSEETIEYLRQCGVKGAKALSELLKDEEFRLCYINKISEGLKRRIQEEGFWWKGKSHTEETKKKIGAKSAVHQSGSGNSQYGKMWIHSLEEKRSTRINKGEPIPEGWLPGRKIKF